MEVFPIFIAVPILLATWRRFPLTPLVYTLIFVHALHPDARRALHLRARAARLLDAGRCFDFSRNHYDRIGHLAQGFVPAIIAREILLRRTPLRPGGWLFFIVCCICLAVSACYEFVEWWAALIGGAAATEFLGTQGDAVGYAVGHAHGADWIDRRSGAALARARSTAVQAPDRGTPRRARGRRLTSSGATRTIAG